MSSDVVVNKDKYDNEESLLDAVLLWSITVYQSALAVLFVWLILAPYYGSAASMMVSIDPKVVAPFSWDGIGEALIQWSFVVLCLAGPLGIFGVVLKAIILRHDMHKMHNISGTIHIASGVISLLIMLFSCSFGMGIMHWLAD